MTVSTSVTVRPYHDEDYDGVSRLLLAEGWAHALPTLADVDLYGVAYVATSDGVVGFIRALSDGYAVAYIAEVVVDPAQRGQGIGRRLVMAVEMAYPTARVDVLSAQPATGFYDRVGYSARAGYRKWQQ